VGPFLAEKKLKRAKSPALDSSGHTVFGDVQVCGVDGKDLGVIAKKQLNPGLIFGYGGRVITKSEMTNSTKTLNKGYYVLVGHSDTYVDAHLRLSILVFFSYFYVLFLSYLLCLCLELGLKSF
jgi:hypothetical protein